jgi:Holliday junction resolvase
LDAVTGSMPAAERAAYLSALDRPFLVVRAAGSLGADLVALRHDLSFLVEVKSSKQAHIHFSDSPRLREQIAEIRAQCERSGVLPIYAFRRKGVRGGDAWRLFTLPGVRLYGPVAQLATALPQIEKTAKGNDVLHWEKGMALAAFLERVMPKAVTLPVASPVPARP